MTLAEISAPDLVAISNELHLSPKETAKLLKLWARGKVKKLRKAIIRHSIDSTRACFTSVAGREIRELAEEGEFL